MITNVYYYNLYAPYILNNFKRKKIAEFPRGERFLSDGDETYILNKALKNEVIGYATELTGVVNGLKDSSKNIVKDAGEFLKNEREEGFVTAVKWLEGDLADFVGAYNKTMKFSKKNRDSRILTDFADTLNYDLSISLKALSKYFIIETDDDCLIFDEKSFARVTKKRILIANKQNLPFFEHVYGLTGNLLLAPLSEHMNFKNLKYYYNYKTGTISKDSFAITGSGMIVNEVC